jgi:hypothetical protein
VRADVMSDLADVVVLARQSVRTQTRGISMHVLLMSRLALLAAVSVVVVSGCTPADDTGEGEGEGEGEEDAFLITEDRTLEGTLAPPADIVVTNGATLTIAPGSVITFATGRALRVLDGALKADGTSDDPILLKGVDAGRGRFAGVALSAETRSGTSLSFVTIDGAGGSSPGCLSLDNVPADRVALADVTLKNCSTAALSLRGAASSLTSFDRIAMEGADVGVVADAAMVGDVDERITTTDVGAHSLIGGTIEASVQVAGQSEAWHVEGSLEVGGTASPVLTCAAGTTLRFEGGHWLRVGSVGPGGLVAAGTAEQPVLLSSIDTGASKGSWLGVSFEDDTLSGTQLAFTTIEAGGEDNFGSRGCVSIPSNTLNNKLALSDLTLRNCRLAGIGIDDGASPFATFDRVTFNGCDVGISSGVNALDGVDEAATYVSTPRNVLLAGTVDRDITIVAQPVFTDVDGSIDVVDGATLTLTAGTELRFPTEDWLRIGPNGSAGRLVANGTAADQVVLGSVDENATAASWLGVYFESGTLSGSALTHTVVKQAGQDAFGSQGGISIFDEAGAGDVVLANVSFENNGQADVFHSCNDEPTLTNTSGVIVNDCDD